MAFGRSGGTVCSWQERSLVVRETHADEEPRHGPDSHRADTEVRLMGVD